MVPIRKKSAKRRVGNLIGLELIPDQFGKQSGDVDLSGEEVGKGKSVRGRTVLPQVMVAVQSKIKFVQISLEIRFFV